MQVGIMISDGNNVHAPDYHAEVTAGKIILVAEDASVEKVTAARGLRKKVEAILTAHHQKVHVAEQSALNAQGAARYGVELDASEHVDDAIIAAIAAATRGTILESHFSRREVQDAIRAELHQETRSQMNVHRLVHQRAAELAGT